LSSPLAKGKWSGRVILGPDDGMRRSEVQITEIEGSRTLAWNESTEAEYMHRISAKAATRAQKMLDTARAQAVEIRKQAHEEGLRQGREQARAEIDAKLKGLAKQMKQITQKLEAAGHELWVEHREDLASLVCLAVEKITGLELADRRKESLNALLEQAVERLEAQRKLVIRAHPDDHELIKELMERIKEHAGIERWKLRPDKSLTPGGLVLESEHGMVENTLESRRQRVCELLHELLLPGGPGAAA